MKKKPKSKALNIFLVGTLVISAFFRGHSLDIILGTFYGLFVIYLTARYVISKRKANEANKTKNTEESETEEPDTE